LQNESLHDDLEQLRSQTSSLQRGFAKAATVEGLLLSLRPQIEQLNSAEGRNRARDAHVRARTQCQMDEQGGQLRTLQSNMCALERRMEDRVGELRTHMNPLIDDHRRRTASIQASRAREACDADDSLNRGVYCDLGGDSVSDALRQHYWGNLMNRSIEADSAVPAASAMLLGVELEGTLSAPPPRRA